MGVMATLLARGLPDLGAAAGGLATGLQAVPEAGGDGRFDRIVDGLNRLPRPFLAFGALALFGYAMADPAGFTLRMKGLRTIPDPLWWILGAVVGFHFGAREAFYLRKRGETGEKPPSA